MYYDSYGISRVLIRCHLRRQLQITKQNTHKSSARRRDRYCIFQVSYMIRSYCIRYFGSFGIVLFFRAMSFPTLNVYAIREGPDELVNQRSSISELAVR